MAGEARSSCCMATARTAHTTSTRWPRLPSASMRSQARAQRREPRRLRREAVGAAAHRRGLSDSVPNIAPAELTALDVPRLVAAGAKNMIKEEHTRLIASRSWVPNCLRRERSFRDEQEPRGTQRSCREVFTKVLMKPTENHALNIYPHLILFIRSWLPISISSLRIRSSQ